ncbi:MAG: AMP-polyphosphate phosphotransferase [Candidatus Sumerlaeota bacterium]|nr:AMP-polyphosphate phosphotransferase [Candidatus Sumerlaeota bacterium]
MLEQLDLSETLSKSEYKERLEELTPQLRMLQVEQRQLGIPMIVVFEGWDCAGKGEAISSLAEILDPRGFKVHVTFEPTQEEARRPFLWRFWTQTPANGELALFDRSWYQRVLTERVDGLVKRRQWRRGYEQITCFERQLADSGTHIIKFFLHISKKEQKQRFEAFEADPVEKWRVRKEDWEHHKKYSEFLDVTEEMLFRTDAHCAPWVLMPAECQRFARIQVLTTLRDRMREAVEQVRALPPKPSQTNPEAPAAPPTASGIPSVLDRVDLTQSVSKKKYEEELAPLQTRLRELNLRMNKKGMPGIIVYEGWDAAGKGGNIKRLVARLDPRGYDVISIAKPTGDELVHHYLWRFWKQIPPDGRMTIFDRSWYGRLLVERVEGFCSEGEWKRAFQEINEFEDQLAAHGTVIVKFWVHIDRDEQERRFKAREATPHKRWKITAEDWRNREKWNLYEPAAVEMLQRTSTPHAPWTIIAGNDKRHARLQALRTVIDRLENALK